MFAAGSVHAIYLNKNYMNSSNFRTSKKVTGFESDGWSGCIWTLHDLSGFSKKMHVGKLVIVNWT